MEFDINKMLKKVMELDKEIKNIKNARNDLYRAYVNIKKRQNEY
tara:strand:- start:480 stop:611 length:132 start_codon:yes stop_codon:yes gene_type:complete